MHTMINGEQSMNQETADDYGNVAARQTVLEGNFMERVDLTKRKHKFKLLDKTTFFCKESVVYPFINFERMVNFYILTVEDFHEIITYVEHHGMISL